ncbi:unnamed protein product [Chondrus crispus]|uniref:C3H1-type domain-containing protein n=1 Tax=Chondrus crispus TaxID=2769 RepID=R7Q2S9_CHOCR|nr:unnamed protein product [Chondrus crispus]CDF32339.1 unnamed protein product [Chondrus crispus]|eukprot:XP_005712004.1 unnamed protein product [Chondrus crispus]
MPKKHTKRRDGTQEPSDLSPISGRGGFTHSRPASDVGDSGNGQSQQICYEFQSNGSCKVGDKCHYSHKVPNTRRENTNYASGSPQSPLCSSFMEKGSCCFGGRCKFSHANSPQGHQKARASPHHTSDTIVEFLNRVQKALSARHFRLDISKPRDLELWMQCWAVVGKGAQAHHACTLARAIMRFPATTILAPPPNDVLSVLFILVHSCAKQTQNARSLVETLEHVADVVENRLRSYPAEISLHERSDCEAKTQELRSISHGAILRSISDPSLATRGAILVTRLLPLLDGLACSYKRQITDDTDQDHGIAVEADDKTWSGWRTPTLAWLQKGEWLDAPHLIRSNDSVDHYIHTLRRLVTMLTFYWGAGAVFPKCQTRGQDDQSCRRPLCTVISNARKKKCRRRLSGGKICMRPAHWRCSRSGHDVACQRCLAEQQHKLTSNPGPRASTDVYDCLVERDTVRRDGVVYVLSQMKSRKPPSVSPNWKTTYRLKCSALVAVMRLRISGEPLSSQHALQWAEVVPVNQKSGSGKDFHERSKGRLALRLLNRADVSTLPRNEEGLERGAWVAVIDLQVLVPEVISVLSTITDVEFHSHLEQLLFSDVLIGSREIRTEPIVHTSIEQAIESALAISEIDLIKRLPENIRSDLSRSLVQLAKNANLYGTQLRALSASLSSPMHCTQGPPGTGKSYVGVVLVRALDVIRSYATKSGMSVGPIVVLSYKNRPLDQFLLDVMKAEGCHSSLVRGMIRCGKPEDGRLHQYCEGRNAVEIRAQETLSRRVASLRAVKGVLRSWRKVQDEFGESFTEQAERLKTLRTIEVKTSLAFGERVYDAVLVLAHALLLHGRVNAADSCNELNSATAYGLIQSLLRDDLSTLDLHHEGIEHLSSLNKGTEHWLTIGKSRMVFLLDNWLGGSNPPPRCVAPNDAGGCVMASTVLATPVEVRCEGITTKQKRCKTVGNASHGSTFFCNAHSAQKPTSVHNDGWCEGAVISTIGNNHRQAQVASAVSGYLSSSDEWNWNQSHSKRWSLVSEFLGGVIRSIDDLVVLAEDHVELARRELQEAAAYAFKKARLIGSTIVGATGRLKAIRASEPFAMVVEEACEVLEPTLVSVLAVRSLRKLELIRNHRQLPAYVQPCWFPTQVNFRSTKVSLLERLVQSGAGGGAGRTSHCTVLDEQRPMRPEVSALTNCEYEDVVNITDHACTLSQRISDCQFQPTIKRTWSSLKDKEPEPESSERDLWYGQGNAVPGLESAVFFWEIEGEEERTSVGLSRCNNKEAEFCAGLVRWLLQCGVAPAGITVITPYKGQKIKIVKKLRGIPGAVLGQPNGTKGARRNEVTVSTVDRYEGDENDVVILSLVCTRPDNLFTAIQNQITIEASRAPIGFYILGSSRAFGSNHQNGSAPLHWLRLLKDRECSHTNAGQGANEGIMGQPSRIGRKLDIRCPRHPDSSKEISTPSDFPAKREELASFCSKPCTFSLPWCSHLCQELCHSSSQRQHTSKCKMLVPRPCDTHSEISLHCCNVRQKQNMEAESLKDALSKFQCEVIVPYHRPECSHVLKISCHQYMGILDGSLKLKNCEKAVADYVHPVCGHRSLGPSCYRRRQWENEPPVCKVAVDHIRSCGCEVRQPCHDKMQECAMIEAPLCQEAVSRPRPRCSHLLSSRCYESMALQELWSQEGDEAVNCDPPVIRYGIIYGPSEADISQAYPSRFTRVFKECFVETKYLASCGHSSIVLCSKAFKLAVGTIDEPPCTEIVIFQSPICGHQIASQCYLRTACRALANTVFEEHVNLATGQVQRFAQERMLRAAPPLDPILNKLRNACSCSVVIARECGHETSAFSCSRIFASLKHKKFPSCNAPVVLKRPCGHPCTVSCHHRGNTLPVCSEYVDEVFKYPCGKSGHTLQPKTCHHLRLLQASTDIQCPLQVKAVRARCGHAFELPCHMEGKLRKKTPGSCLNAKISPRIVQEGADYCESALGVPACLERVSYRRMCGHIDSDVQCDIAFQWAEFPQEAPACRHEIAMKSPLCEHQLLIACNQKADILAADLWRGQPPERITLSMDDEVRTCPVVHEGVQLPALPALQTIALLRCGESTLLQRKCGHEKTVPCETIFTAMTSICEQLENVECAGCGQTSAQPCHELKKNPDGLRCNRVVKKKCSVCRINITPAPCYMEAVQCGSVVNANLQCGHEISWQCGDEDPRWKPLMKVCIVCTHKRWLDVHATVSLQKEVAAKASPRNEKTTILANAAENRLHGANSCDIFNINALLAVLRSRALENLPESWIMKCDRVQCIPVERLLQSYLRLLQQNIDNFAAAIRNGERERRLCAPPQFPSEDGAYDIIYCTRTSKEEPEDCFRSLMTRYGMGITGKILSEKSIVHESEKRRHNAPWSIFVGAVLRHQMLDDVEPFMAQVRSDCCQTEARKKALKQMQSCRAKGYDHISLKPMGEPFGRVFWTAGSVIPLYQVELQFHRRCEICMDNIPAFKAWGCPDDHFLCGECFGSYAKRAQEPGTLRRIVDQDGNLACPHDGCKRTYDILHLLRQRQDASEEELQPLQSELEKLKIATHAKRHVKAALDVQKMELEAEFKRIQQIQDLDERRAEILRLEIIDQILTLRCPNCRMAFIDFDGCFDLTCDGCMHHFCAWCISHFSRHDVHSHVAHCPKSPQQGAVYGQMEQFTRLHSVRRRQLVVQRLKGEVREVQKLTLARVRGELQDLNIHIKLDQLVTD